MPQASALASFLLLSLTVAAVSSAFAPAAFDHDAHGHHQADDHHIAPMSQKRRQQLLEDEASGDEKLVITNRAGTHVFWMHHGRAVSAQLGANRVYKIRETFFVSEVCTCDKRRRPGHRKVCLKRFKPAFYALVALASLLAVAGLVTVCCLAARAVRNRRRCVAAAAAKSPFSDRRSLMAAKIWGESGSGQKLSIQCDPIAWDGDNFQKIAL